MDPTKIEPVLKWERKICSFHALLESYRRSVENYVSISSSHTSQTRKNARFIWNDDCERAFEELKHQLTSASNLRILNRTDGFSVYKDASQKGFGLCNHTKWKRHSVPVEIIEGNEKNYPRMILTNRNYIRIKDLAILSLWCKI